MSKLSPGEREELLQALRDMGGAAGGERESGIVSPAFLPCGGTSAGVFVRRHADRRRTRFWKVRTIWGGHAV